MHYARDFYRVESISALNSVITMIAYAVMNLLSINVDVVELV